MKSIRRQAGFVYYVRSAWSVFIKDLICELRARNAISAVILFAVTSTVAVSFTCSVWGGDSDIS